MKTAEPIFLAGRFVAGEGEAIKVRSPYTGRVLKTASAASRTQVEQAIALAHRATRDAASLPSHARASACRAIADGIRDDARALADLMQREGGKVRRDAEGEVRRAEQTFRVAAEEAGRIGGELIDLDWTPGSEKRFAVTRRFPLGVVSGITPFNFPLNLVAHKVAPAVASGNCIVVKPASSTPLVALALARIIEKVDLPRGMVSIVPARAHDAGPLVADERVRLVTFTGSAEVGFGIAESTRGRKRLVLELGGNAAVVVDDDARLDYAVERCVFGGYSQAGQSCISVQRVIVHEKVRKRFESALVDRVRALRPGDPLDPRTDVGPLIDSAAAERVESWIAAAKSGGGKVLCGGTRVGNVVEPTVIADPPRGADAWDREVFGPIVCIKSYGRFADALAMVNDSRYGLQAGVFTQRAGDIAEAFRTLEVGGLVVNDVPTWRADHMPYGGTKESGMGREGPRYAIQDMTEERTLVLNLL